MNNAPFPQANDFGKVITIVNVENEEKLKDYDRMGVLLGDVSSRQVDYYTAACAYLGILDEEKHFTPLGKSLRTMHGIDQLAELARIVVSDKVFGTVYFQQKFSGLQLEKNDVIEIMKENVLLATEPMYERRASTVISWVKWILSHETIL